MCSEQFSGQGLHCGLFIFYLTYSHQLKYYWSILLTEGTEVENS